MIRYILLFLHGIIVITALNLDYLDPTKLQTRITPAVQQETALNIIRKYVQSNNVIVEVNPLLFNSNRDTFSLRTSQGQLRIRASTGIAALWGFNYYLKKYCKSHIGWQVKRISMPSTLPEVDETVTANDRFRYYQNVCTASYSFVWWTVDDWKNHVEWMALNGINLSLAPVAQEAAWTRIYKQIGMTQEEINEHFTGPAFLSWQRMGNLRGWGGPLFQSWHNRQRDIQIAVVDMMFKLGIVPVFPAFNGHVPKAFSRIYPKTTFYKVNSWNDFNTEYCCGLFLDPGEPLFKTIGTLFLKEVTVDSGSSHIYTADPFNEISISSWSTPLIQETAMSIFSTMTRTDENAVWLLQNWMFVHDPVLWPKNRVKAFLSSVPNGRMLILDLQSEQWPQYDFYEMYFGQPFIWNMLHNFGGTLGMFGSMDIINTDVYEARSQKNSTMIGIGLTPEGINQNYVVYDLMLESAWRKGPVRDLDAWVGEYAARRYGCNDTGVAWKYLRKSVYSFKGLNRIRGKYVINRRPSFRIRPWAWYSSRDLFKAFEKFVFVYNPYCYTEGYFHDLVDVTRQALQYRAEQLYSRVLIDRYSNNWVFNASINRFLDAMSDIEKILYASNDFSATQWLTKATDLGITNEEKYHYVLNARNQITLWGPNGEISDYASKQWRELFTYYYIPRWTTFLRAALDAKVNREIFDERSVQDIIKSEIEEQFVNQEIVTQQQSYLDITSTAIRLYKKWALLPNLDDLPLNIIERDLEMKTTWPDTVESDVTPGTDPTVLMWQSSTPN
ncbi:alpha-N-acetylglucosaminidase [Achroia grisella]|uniref:alpha-N-acetylglucosaminidase n=1 Tax=Achroia grisella TaxID=688607 RepID=UPI0027D23F58|nr:alpha-N-acetylglucosaminidase [Achroia grisella]